MFRQKEKINKIIPVVFAVISMIFLGCSVTEKTKDDDIGVMADLTGYIKISKKDQMFYQISSSDLLKLFQNKESGIAMISRENCIYCQNAMHVLRDAAKNNNAYIYYLDSNNPTPDTSTKEEKKKIYEELCYYIEPALKEDESGEKVLYVPLLIKIEEGKMIDYHFSLVSTFSVEKSLELNNEEEKELYQIYEKIIKE